ncbi:hypothetical protein K432DRAFT_405393 [Lepidopterella palustris CBS 459.81]|uniref:Uncharacterized protein n=1 Tax=Lepidopterella palustris CBS 459.81 TaxID=1314670 RepID=A0A8E2JF32_9PEZI|nr:hypothetical protein K432DRAFT_405393 [Lepidopterella palustris CBS 459.81]
MSHTYSLSWASPETKEAERYQVVMNAMRRLFPKTDFNDMDMPTWLEQRQAIIQARGRQLGRSVAFREDQRERGLPPITKLMRGREPKENRGAVLCQQTIWCLKWDMKADKAPWPSLSELKWEGDDRAKTSVGRYLPLPREPGNATVAWHHLRVLQAFDFDEVRKVPTLEDILLPVDEIDDNKVPELINADLLEALDSDEIF